VLSRSGTSRIVARS